MGGAVLIKEEYKNLRLFERLFRKNEIRSEVISADDQIMRALSGVEVSPDTAMEIPAVSACVDFISQVIASLPVKLFCENREKNITEEIKDDPRLRLLNDETGDLLDPVQMKQAVIKDYFLRGGGFIYPEMDNNRVVSLRYIGRKFISIYNKSYDPVFKVGEYILTNGMTLRDDQLIKVLRETDDGLTGYSIIDQHQQLLSGMYRSLLYEKMLVTTGGNKKGFLVSDVKLDEKSMDALRKAWNEMYANTGNTMMILNKGLTFHESSNTSVEMQLSENKVRNNELACQIFGMSADAVSGRLNDEGLAAIIKSAVIPVITVFEAALNKGLLLPSERDLKYFSFDTTEMLRGDILKRYQAYKMGLESNVLQIDEVRYKEDLPPLGLNWIKLGLQDVLYDPKTKTIYTPNMNQYMQMGENKLPETVDSGAEGGIIDERNFNPLQPRDKYGRWTSSGGGDESGSNGNSDNEKNQKELDEAVKSGKVKTKLNKSRQSKHKYGSEDYNKAIKNGELPSYTELSHMEVQKIINNHEHDGEVIVQDGQFKKVITEKDDFAMYGDLATKKYYPTNRATIHYSKDGTHLVPAKPEGFING